MWHWPFKTLNVRPNWYVEVLGFERRFQGMWKGVPVFIGLGETSIALFPLGTDPTNASSSGRTVGMLHLALRADRRNFVDSQQELKRRGIPFQFQDHEISHSIYFLDPDGIRLEITTYDV